MEGRRGVEQGRVERRGRRCPRRRTKTKMITELCACAFFFSPVRLAGPCDFSRVDLSFRPVTGNMGCILNWDEDEPLGSLIPIKKKNQTPS